MKGLRYQYLQVLWLFDQKLFGHGPGCCYVIQCTGHFLFDGDDDDDDGEVDDDENYYDDVDDVLIMTKIMKEKKVKLGKGFQCQGCSDLWGKDGHTSQLVRQPPPPSP